MANAELGVLNSITKMFGTIVCALVTAGVVGIWVMVIDVSSLKTKIESFDQRLGRIEALIDNSLFGFREDL